MPVFSPAALNALPQALAQFMTASADAPAALVGITDGTRSGLAASGSADLTTGAAVPTDATYEIGSQTKMMTATVVLQLAEAGLINLDAPLATYLPVAITDMVANADYATVGQALAMRSGIPNYTEVSRADGSTLMDHLEAAWLAGAPVTLDQSLAFLDGVPARFAPGTAYEYSNTDYALLGLVVESVTGQSLGDVFAAQIFDPLGMSDTKLHDFAPDPARVSSYVEHSGELIDVTDFVYETDGEGGVISTTSDMMTFLSALLVDQTLLSDDALAIMTDFSAGWVDARGFAVANGLVAQEVPDLGTFVGFAGGTLGTDSATYLHVDTGRIVSGAVTVTGLDVDANALITALAGYATEEPAWTAPSDADAPLIIDGVSAADLEITTEGDVTVFSAQDAAFDLGQLLRSFDTDDFAFTDGSVLTIGGAAEDTVVLEHGTDAWRADNRLLGFGGKDALSGGRGDDVIKGHGGRDILKGLDGADRIVGGKGNDRLVGGHGDDVLSGGQGRDVFVFGASLDNGRVETDVITDFTIGVDRLQLTRGSVVEAMPTDTGLCLTLGGADGDVINLLGVTETDLAMLF